MRGWILIWVVAASALPNYRQSVRFSDGAEGELDLRDFIVEDSRPIVQSLGDPALFGALRVDLDTVVWPNGFDLAPEFLRARLKSAA